VGKQLMVYGTSGEHALRDVWGVYQGFVTRLREAVDGCSCVDWMARHSVDEPESCSDCGWEGVAGDFVAELDSPVDGSEGITISCPNCGCFQESLGS